MSRPVATGKMAESRVEPGVLWKLILFAVLMAVAPIGTYFGTLNYLWAGSTTKSAISAVVAANIVLVGYVWVAFVEDAQRSGPLPIRAGAAGTGGGGKEGRKEK